ncbi:Putative lipase EstA/Esterase EstB, alpha/Beta hydrolase [Septoria linicola]|uniref:Lipase EstA/Esterase EstB, alpha/Beta hydrolase n=1 Tax=Septoria linicola TaxID=215465 RepID=A0A9Q9AQ26_9PEZI|nr:putative lipase EstA/Esterase EstB, alpha/Beta hydrolase [Septoria linicola]USW52389.1 Putative lipase EstA/Esterase EstB, alpha/Beta hydrolase [Septoria linicola]
MALRSLLALLLYISTQHEVEASIILRRQDTSATHNNFACRSAFHPNPVIVFHGLGCNAYSCINQLYDFLGSVGFCTFSTTYGVTFPGLLPFELGGTTSISQSSAELAAFVWQVITQTGASKVDFVGHSEGALQVLYVPKFYPYLSMHIDQVFAIAPPTHGTDLNGIYDLAYIFGDLSREFIGDLLQSVGCGACDDLGIGGPAVLALNAGKITQPGIQYTVLATIHDEFVTPTTTAFIDEPGVQNYYIQQFCPLDNVGHAGLPFDEDVQRMIANTLARSLIGPGYCSTGPQPATAGLGTVQGLGSSDLTPPQRLFQGLNNIVGNVQGFKQ